MSFISLGNAYHRIDQAESFRYRSRLTRPKRPVVKFLPIDDGEPAHEPRGPRSVEQFRNDLTLPDGLRSQR